MPKRYGGEEGADIRKLNSSIIGKYLDFMWFSMFFCPKRICNIALCACFIANIKYDKKQLKR